MVTLFGRRFCNCEHVGSPTVHGGAELTTFGRIAQPRLLLAARAMRAGPWALALLPGAAAYAHMSSQYQVDWRFAWSMPLQTADDVGLGGGIRYAIDPGRCPDTGEGMLIRQLVDQKPRHVSNFRRKVLYSDL